MFDLCLFITIFNFILIVLCNDNINSSSSGQNGHHLTDNILRCIFMNEKFCILIKISLKYVPKGPIYNNPALVQIMAWRRIGAKPLSDSNAAPIHWRINAALEGDVLKESAMRASVIFYISLVIPVMKQHCDTFLSSQWEFPHNGLIFIVGIPEPLRQHLYINSLRLSDAYMCQ